MMVHWTSGLTPFITMIPQVFSSLFVLFVILPSHSKCQHSDANKGKFTPLNTHAFIRYLFPLVVNFSTPCASSIYYGDAVEKKERLCEAFVWSVCARVLHPAHLLFLFYCVSCVTIGNRAHQSLTLSLYLSLPSHWPYEYFSLFLAHLHCVI